MKYKKAKKLDPMSLVRKGELKTKVKKLKKLDPKSLVRKNELKKQVKKAAKYMKASGSGYGMSKLKKVIKKKR